MSVQADIVTRGLETSYGGRIGMNFNTPYSIDVWARRPRYDDGRGVTISGMIGYEMEEYKPPVCFLFGVRYTREPTDTDEDLSTTMIPVGLGIGKRLGSAKGLSLALFVIPEYLYVADPKPVGDFDDFWDELRARSQARGVIGLLVASPFIYARGSIELATFDDYVPTVSLGVGLTF